MSVGSHAVAISARRLIHSPIAILTGRMGVHEADKRNLFALGEAAVSGFIALLALFVAFGREFHQCH